jgi:hypothetical protein
MRDSILQRIFRRVQISRSEGIVLDAILSKANLFGKHAKVAYECIAAITGFSVRHVMRLVKSLIYERRLLRVDKRVLWYAHNAINVYHVVIPWRREVSFEEMGSGKPYPRQDLPAGRQDKQNNKYDRACHPKSHTERKIPIEPARPCSEKEASKWLTPGTLPWYFAQGLTPPAEKAENGNGNGC